MNTRANTRISQDAAVGAIPEIETACITVIACVLLIAACFAAPVLLELPELMDAAASPQRTIREIADGGPEAAHLQTPQSAQLRLDAAGSADEHELATSRLHASD